MYKNGVLKRNESVPTYDSLEIPIVVYQQLFYALQP